MFAPMFSAVSSSSKYAKILQIHFVYSANVHLPINVANFTDLSTDELILLDVWGKERGMSVFKKIAV